MLDKGRDIAAFVERHQIQADFIDLLIYFSFILVWFLLERIMGYV